MRFNLKKSNCNNIEIIDSPIASKDGEIINFGTNSFLNNASFGDSTSQIQTKDSIDSKKLITTSIHKILDVAGRDTVSFIKVDIEGGEETILTGLFEECFNNNYKLFLSFHYDWWQDKNLERYRKLFESAKSTSANGDIIEFIKKHPMGDIYFEF